ncbi:MAG TPA: M28 family peptidase, partial [Rhizomicrobium sp.]|nr:M28 family peptidase [Rhizomicrobium sp.]
MEHGIVRIWGIALLAAVIWLLSVYGQSRPAALGPDAPATQFSAVRADAVLGRLLGDQGPHPVGSQAAAQVRSRLLDELHGMGVQARTQTTTSCTSEPRWNNIPCATVTNITADVLAGTGKAILLMAHTDSVAAGPGAGDDGAGVATIVETIRALKARGAGGHPVTALFTDGEEDGLLGATAWLKGGAARTNVGAVVNIEARGNQGPSYLFQTSKGDAGLIGLYAKGVTHVAASSLYAEIYRFMPNDTDMTPFLAAGIPGANFAFVGNVAQYHTPLDRRENVDPRSLQQHGENALELTDALRHADLATLQGGDAIYLDVLGVWLPRLPKSWSLPLSLAAFAVIALAGWLKPRDRRETRHPIIAGLMPPLLFAGCIGMGFALHYIAAWLSGHADPSFAYPAPMRLALGFGVFAVAILCARGAGAIACWLWLSFLAIACSVFSPGAAPYVLFPSLVAAPLLLVTVRGGREAALWTSAFVTMLLWIGLTASTEVIMGLGFTVLFTATAAFGLIAVLPLLKAPGWGFSLAAALVLSIGLAVFAGLQPAFSTSAPQRLNIRYVEQDGKASWLVDPVEHLPA